MCHCSNLNHINNYNNDYSFIILTWFQSYCKPHLFVILFTGLFFTTAELVLFTCNFTQGWLNFYWLPSALFCSFIVQQDQSNERAWNRTLACSFLREVYYDCLHMCIFILVCPSCLLLMVYFEGVFVCCAYITSCCFCGCYLLFQRWCWWWFNCPFVCTVVGVFVYQTCYRCWYSFCVLFFILNDIRSFQFLWQYCYRNVNGVIENNKQKQCDFTQSWPNSC